MNAVVMIFSVLAKFKETEVQHKSLTVVAGIEQKTHDLSCFTTKGNGDLDAGILMHRGAAFNSYLW